MSNVVIDAQGNLYGTASYGGSENCRMAAASCGRSHRKNQFPAATCQWSGEFLGVPQCGIRTFRQPGPGLLCKG